MILISLFGGLGNQLFQYATAKALSAKHGYELKMDPTILNFRGNKTDFSFRNFELNHFCIPETLASPQEISRFVPDLWHSPEYLKQWYKLKRLFTGTTLYREKEFFKFNEALNAIEDNTYLYGYYQTQNYFVEQEELIRECLQLRSPLDPQNSALVAEMQSVNSVSVHIRRGDYENSIFRLLTVENYYMPALKLMLDKQPDCRFYFFTNDAEWTKNAFAGLKTEKTFITHNTGKDSYKDMILMSKCKHHIIANSTFSWWGAWLNPAKSKTVIAPAKWYQSGKYADSVNDLIPADWIKI